MRKNKKSVIWKLHFLRYYKLYLIAVFYFVLQTGYVLEFLKEYAKEEERQKQDVVEAFYQGLDEELNVRLDKLGTSRSRKGVKKRKNPIAKIQTEKGMEVYRLDSIKDKMNISSDSHIRAKHSASLKKYPLIADSLYLGWKERVKESHIGTEMALLYEINKGEKSVVGDSVRVISRDSLFTCYVGYGCEYIYKGYATICLFSVIKNMVFWIIPFVLFSFLFSFLLIQCKPKQPVLLFAENNKPLVLEEKRLNEEAYNIGEQWILKVAEKSICDKFTLQTLVKLTNIEVKIMLAFLSAKDYKLLNEDLQEKAWSGTIVSDSTIRTGIYRLNKDLVSGNVTITVHSIGKGYQLVISQN